jgi:hypothetical protein
MRKGPVTTLDACDEAFEVLTSSCTTFSAKRIAIAQLLGPHQTINFELGRGRPFWRARKCQQEGYQYECELSYPPAALTPSGRLNDQGAPCLYLATRKETAFTEIGVVEGDYVHIAGYRVLADKTIRALGIGEWLHVQKTGYLRAMGQDPQNSLSRTLNSFPYEQGMLILYIDALLSSILADPDAGKNGYETTRLIAAMAYKKLPATNAIFYPSVQADLGMNLAVKPSTADRCMHNVCSAVVKIKKARKFGVYEYEVVKTATDIGDDGKFQWEKAHTPRSLNVYRLTKSEYDAGGESILDMHSERVNATRSLTQRLRDAIQSFRA